MSGETEDLDTSTGRLIGIGSGVMNLFAFTVVGFILFEDPVYGAILGSTAGLGSYFFVPWIIQFSVQQERATEQSSGTVDEFQEPIETLRSDTAGAVGLSLEIGAIVMFVARFIVDDLVISVGTGILAILVIGFVASILIPKISN